MKQSKRLTYEQKKLLDKKGYEPKEWRYIEEDNFAIRVINITTGEIAWVEKR